jgi:colanic acid biosynthesis glycosyl transferase WcaI
MRILIVTQYYWPENFRINDLTTGLIDRGHELTVLTGVPNYPSGSIFPEFRASPELFLNYKGAKIVRVPIVPRGRRRFQLVLNYLSFVITASTIGLFRLRKQHFDAVLVFEPSPVTVCLPAVLYRFLEKVPVTLWVLDLWPDTLEALGVVRSKWMLAIVGRLVSFIYNRTDLILGQSKRFLPHIQNYCKHKQIRYFPGWAESVFYDEHLQDHKMSTADSSFNVVFTGNVGESQDFPAILDAAEILKHDNKIRWVIVGDGRMYQWLKHEVEKRVLTDTVILEGRHPIEKIPYFFGQAHALLLSLKDEPIFSLTIPGKLQAYLKAGKPIIAMLNGEGADIVSSNKCGIACLAGDSEALASAVKRLSEMTVDERKMMGDKGLKLSDTDFDRTNLIDKLECWFQQMVDQQSLAP